MSAWIGDTFRSDTGWIHLERPVDVDNRMGGSEGERRAAEATRDALDRVGARDARLKAFSVQGWTGGTSRVEGGAAAFVYRNHVPGQLPPTGSVGTDCSPVGDVPAVGVNREVGGRPGRRAVRPPRHRGPDLSPPQRPLAVREPGV